MTGYINKILSSLAIANILFVPENRYDSVPNSPFRTRYNSVNRVKHYDSIYKFILP